MCLNPKWIYKKGFYKETNYRGEKGQFYELGTYSKCGACQVCIADKCNNWVIRNYYEAKTQEKKCFITLTYATTPIILIRKELQDFMKRLREYINKDYTKKFNKFKKNIKELPEETKEILINEWKQAHQEERTNIRIFGAGEYGELNNRPHFHVIIYGWEEKPENLTYLDINEKNNILYTSKTIAKTWGKGRTSYQKWNDKEIPYLALYNTAQETFKRAYKITLDKCNQLERYAISKKGLRKDIRKNLIQELNECRKKLNEEKQKYYAIKEFNAWSIALGWESFYNEYANQEEYTFTEYIEDCQYPTPSPWVKKLANQGDIPAIKEMYKREEEIIQSATEQEEKIKNELKVIRRKKQEIEEWQTKKDKIQLL